MLAELRKRPDQQLETTLLLEERTALPQGKVDLNVCLSRDRRRQHPLKEESEVLVPQDPPTPPCLLALPGPGVLGERTD